MKRYILNLRAQVYHDRDHLTENCNTDSIIDREQADAPPVGFEACEWCKERGPVENAPAEPIDPSYAPLGFNPNDEDLRGR